VRPPGWQPWELAWTPRAERDLRQLNPQAAARVRASLRRYAATGHGDVTKLADSDDEYRLRIGEWRVRFARDRVRGRLLILRVLRRGRAYRR
jgi:mRNA-degrading endonuclease RelE of RelBE toxin-antitoxin system